MTQQVSNLDKLTEKIYREGVEKADLEAEEIVKKAAQEKEKIIAEASSEAERIIASAKKTASLEARSAESEIKLKGKQLVSDLKGEINRLLTLQILDNNIRESFSDQKFLQSLILEIAGHWRSGEELELVLPEKLKEKVGKAFEKNISEHIDKLVITFNDRLTSGFRISRKADTYDITFSEEDFIELFSAYLKEKTSQYLFMEAP